MNKKTILLITIPILCALLGGALLLFELDARKVPELAISDAPAQEPNMDSPTAISPDPDKRPPALLPQQVGEDVSEPILPPSTTTHAPKTISPNTLIIRGKTFPLKSNIDAETLKKHIGWMESSARPGTPGVCVIMGHRNGGLRILKELEYGDVVTVVDEFGITHSYSVIKGEIVKEGPITYEPADSKILVLITCYPFYYSGQAPHQYVVTAVA